MAPENIRFVIKLKLHEMINETTDCRGSCDEDPVIRMSFNDLQYTIMAVVTLYSNWGLFKVYVNRGNCTWFIMNGKPGSFAAGYNQERQKSMLIVQPPR